ncbi:MULTISPECIES: H-NS family nucleoid-associated regulatory protein [Stenotrophomonas]|uniref:H-NS family nucleoid-associated regulatory protein n=1 Tax=Stenotrophomonas aracearum TaxID=3003272 RepID=A0ABY9YFK5_9GAMM|nr:MULTISPECIES: H-NS family nucleoid-associated regulatory protein [unclassified Stenotrophomonas]WNH49659.1 H-NS family nucleoid-associated regulatory protein [Stenotrophomonas sp. A5588]
MPRTPSASPSPHALLRAATKEAYERVTVLLSTSYADFSPEQQRRIQALVGREGAPPAPRAARTPKAPKQERAPRYWLPHSQETWSGRGRVPQSFLAWEGTVAHTEWKKHHPDERFPAFPG